MEISNLRRFSFCTISYWRILISFDSTFKKQNKIHFFNRKLVLGNTDIDHPCARFLCCAIHAFAKNVEKRSQTGSYSIVVLLTFINNTESISLLCKNGICNVCNTITVRTEESRRVWTSSCRTIVAPNRRLRPCNVLHRWGFTVETIVNKTYGNRLSVTRARFFDCRLAAAACRRPVLMKIYDVP